jgi:hypothetical protein
MSKKIWGNITWRLFHTMTLCINECTFEQIQGSIQCITNICKHLPCPLCSNEASMILKKYNLKNIKTKEDFKRFVNFFHNKVNQKIKAPTIEYENIEELHKNSLNYILNEFFKIYKGLKNNSNMMLYSFHRDMIINNTKTYFLNNRTLYRFN